LNDYLTFTTDKAGCGARILTAYPTSYKDTTTFPTNKYLELTTNPSSTDLATGAFSSLPFSFLHSTLPFFDGNYIACFLTATTEGDGGTHSPVNYEFIIRMARCGVPAAKTTDTHYILVDQGAASVTLDLSTLYDGSECTLSSYIFSSDGTTTNTITQPSHITITGDTMTVTTGTPSLDEFYLVMYDPNNQKSANKKFSVMVDCVTSCDCSGESIAPKNPTHTFYA